MPVDIRGLMHGAICVEWKKESIVLDGGGITGTPPCTG